MDAPQPATFVLVHGAWHGAWCWRFVLERLRSRGHRASAVTLTGLGERAHLLTAVVTLDTFVEDVVGHLEAEELDEVILVGHSFGGLAVCGAADRQAWRIRHLVLLDAALVPAGSSPFDGLPTEVVEQRRTLARASHSGLAIPPPPPAGFAVDDGPLADWVRRRLTPHPLATYESALRLNHPLGNGCPTTYLCCTDPIYRPLKAARALARQQSTWAWRDIAAGHDAMVTAPDVVTSELLRIVALSRIASRSHANRHVSRELPKEASADGRTSGS